MQEFSQKCKHDWCPQARFSVRNVPPPVEFYRITLSNPKTQIHTSPASLKQRASERGWQLPTVLHQERHSPNKLEDGCCSSSAAQNPACWGRTCGHGPSRWCSWQDAQGNGAATGMEPAMRLNPRGKAGPRGGGTTGLEVLSRAQRLCDHWGCFVEEVSTENQLAVSSALRLQRVIKIH